jgi:archaellum component FlaC
MKRKKIKSNGSEKDFVEFGTVLEYIQAQVKVIAEQTGEIGGIKKGLDKVEKRLDNIGVDVDAIKTAMKVMKTDMELIKHGLKRKIDIDEFAALEKRVSTLENRL